MPIGGRGGFPVVALQPFETLVLGGHADGFEWAWELSLVPISRERTRLISRSRARVPHSVGSTLLMLALEPAAFIMTRKMLLGIQRRAEALQRQSRAQQTAGGSFVVF